jgi:AcrR family transcriptional regulator
LCFERQENKEKRMPRPSKSPEQIIQAASELFFTHGYARVTVDEVAAALGMSKRTLYRHFSSKEDLLLAVVEALFSDLQDGIDAIRADPALNATTRLARFIVLLGTKLTQIGPQQQELRYQAPDVWARVIELDETVIIGECRQLLAEGAAVGVIRADIGPELLEALLNIWLRGLAQSDILASFPVSASDAVQALLKTFLGGVLTEAGRAQLLTHPVR